MDSRIPLRDLYRVLVDVIDIAAHECGLACECELSVAFGESPLRLLSLTDIDRHVDYTDNCAGRVAEWCGIRNNGDPSAICTFKNGLQTSHGLAQPQGNLGRTIRESRRLPIRAKGACEIGPPILS